MRAAWFVVYNVVLHLGALVCLPFWLFVRIFRGLTKFRGDSALGTWIYRLSVNAALSYVTRRPRPLRPGLPGDLEAKIMPYLRPLYDALEDLLTPNTMRRFMEEGVVEISPGTKFRLACTSSGWRLIRILQCGRWCGHGR